MKHTVYDSQDSDDFIVIPEELFQYLPENYRHSIEAMKQKGIEALQIVDPDINNFIKLIKAIPTTASLSFIYHQLRKMEFEPTIDWYFQHEALTTAFIVTYSRLFASSSGITMLSRRDIPKHLRPHHDQIIELRNKRYAHNGSHNSLDGAIEILFDGHCFEIQTKMNSGTYIGGKNEWRDLVSHIDTSMHRRISRMLKHLEKKTNCKWLFPKGPPPEWAIKAKE